MINFLVPGLAFLLTAAAIALLLRPGVRSRLLDHPNERSLHSTPTPRSGGVGVCLGLVPALLCLPGLTAIAACATGLALLSLVDDWRSLPARVRLCGHLLAAGVFVQTLPGPLPAGGQILLVLAIGWMTNLYNFMDGADGLAGGMAVTGFSLLGVAAWQAGDGLVATAGLTVAGTALAFLCFNFPPARIFLGDAGSIPLGFLAAALSLLGWQRGLWPLWFGPLLFAPFVVDASVTLLRRAWRGERLWQAHREHCYQRLVLMGWTRRQLLAAEYSLMMAGGLLALALRRAPLPWQLAGLGLAMAGYALLLGAVERAWQARGKAA